MRLVIFLSLLALLSIPLNPLIPFILLVFALLTYYLKNRKRIKLSIRDVTEEQSYFNVLLLSTFLGLLSCFALPKEVVYASIFLLIGYEYRRGVMENIAIYTSLGILFFVLYNLFSKTFTLSEIFFLALAGGLSASLIESVDSDADKRVTLLLATATVFTIFKIYIPSASLYNLAFAFVISFAVSLLALKAKIADETGLLSATIVGTTLILFTDLRYFIIIVVFYLVGSMTTKYKYSTKQRLGIAEHAGGARGYSNVFGNSLAPLFFAMQYGATKNNIFAVAFVASVAAALGDTMASEVGKVAKNVYLITNFKKVQAGVSGGISIPGEIAALSGTVLIPFLAYILKVLDPYQCTIAAISAFIGVHIDSVLGATLEEKGYLTNSAVNFLATLAAGIVSYLFFL